MKGYSVLFTIHILVTGMALAAGSATSGIGLEGGRGAEPVEFYNQGVQLMHAKKFAEAEVRQ